MRRVMDAIQDEMNKLEQRPLFDFLKDKSIDPKHRLAFAPSVAHFVMSFADLYSLVLREDPPNDQYQELVNAHAHEDENHWRWFLADLEKLDADPPSRFSDVLRFVWGESTARTRMLSYHMCRLGLGASSLQKLVLVHCIEGAGKVTVQHVSDVGREFAMVTGKKLVYFGPHHFDTESEHTLEDSGVQADLCNIELDGATREPLLKLVREAFECFAGFIDDMHDSARNTAPTRWVLEPS